MDNSTSEPLLNNLLDDSNLSVQHRGTSAWHVSLLADFDPNKQIEMPTGSVNDHSFPPDSSRASYRCNSSVPIEPDKVAKRQLISVLILCVLFIAGEATGAALSNSLALFTDVLHMLSDLTSFAISLLAFFLATKQNTMRMSFGFYRAEVIGALLSIFLIWLVTGVLCYMAVESIIKRHYLDVKPREMLITASIGVVFNIIMGAILHSEVCCRGKNLIRHNHSHSHASDSQYRELQDLSHDEESHIAAAPTHKNINVRAAFIHVIGDFIQSIGVFIAALIIKFKTDDRFKIADPIMTFIFSILVLFTTITVLRDTLLVMMEGVPRDIKYADVYKLLQSVSRVRVVHNLHVWALTMGKNALIVHLAVDTPDHQSVLEEASALLRDRYKFIEVTIQIEKYDVRHEYNDRLMHALVDS